MEQKNTETDLQLLLNSVHINYDRLNKELSKYYPTAFAEYNEFEPDREDYPFCYYSFFRQWKLSFGSGETQSVKANYTGTFHFKITMPKELAFQLGRTSKSYAYYHINSKQKAVEKMIEKAFEIIECLLTGKELPEKLRRS